MAIEIMDFPLKMVIFHSDVSLPEGIFGESPVVKHGPHWPMNTSPGFFEKDHSSIGIGPIQKSRQPRIKITRYWSYIDQIWTIYGSYIWDWIIPTHPNLCDFHPKKSNPSVLVGVSHPSLSRGRRSGNAEECAEMMGKKREVFLGGNCRVQAENLERSWKIWKDHDWLVVQTHHRNSRFTH